MSKYLKSPEVENTLHQPELERDACGVGVVAHIKGEASHRVLRLGLDSVNNVTHGGAVNADGKTGDGAGVTTNLPSILWPGLKVQISPNPAYDQALLTLDLHQELPLAIEMVNAQGQVVRQVTAMTLYPAGTHRLAIDLSGMESGWYGIRLVNTMGQLTRKILVH